MTKLSLYINPQTGGYESENSTLIKINSTVNKANLLLSQPIGSNIYAMNEGNPLLNETGLIPISEISAGINTCLAPLVNSGEITTLTLLSVELSPTFRYRTQIAITLPNGTTETINWKR